MFDDPEAQTYLLLLSLLPEAITETMLRPLVPFMIRMLSKDLDGDRLESEVGIRAGLFGGVFYMPLLVMNIVWGAASDSLGRKPILLMGLLFGGLTTIALGLNTSSFQLALVCRFLAGIFGGNSTVAKGALGEIHSDAKGRSWAFSLYGSLYAFSGIVGPLIGGVLVEMAGEERSPYFAFFGTVVWYKEVEKHRVDESVKVKEGAEDSAPIPQQEKWVLSPAIKPSKLTISIVLYVTLAFCNMFWASTIPLIFATSLELSGLGFSAMDASFAMTIPSISKLFFQSLFCEWIVRKLGANRSYCVGMGAIVPAMYGLGLLGGTAGSHVFPIVTVCLITLGFVEALAYLSMTIVISESVPSTSLGSAFGLTSTFAALVRSLAPPLAGTAWEYAVELKAPWVAFLVVQAVALISVGIAFLTQPTEELKKKSE
ncbi:hypothetical protein HDU79_001979 [Rhizoclosmatium sp. JEL0117]|nr:hypothetical protein HDU79_001979 [Rhizoclosmatium sp. JEL0117]